MSPFTVLRTVFLVLFVLINMALCTAAAINISFSSSTDAMRPVEVYMIFYTALSILFLFPIILIDLLRTGALTSKVWFECLWLFVAALLNLIGAVGETMTMSTCMSKKQLSCQAGRALLPITWSASFLVLAQLALMVISATYYSQRHPDVWSASIRHFQWFNGGGSGKSTNLGSGPPSPAFVPRRLTLQPTNSVPHLEAMAERWEAPAISYRPPVSNVLSAPISTQAAPAAGEPRPLTLEYAPVLPPSRPPIHYNATASFSVGVVPARRPSRKKAPALYPADVQIAINATPPRPSLTSPISPASATRPTPSQRLTTTGPVGNATSAEPLPIRNWPRANPMEPAGKEKSKVPSAAPLETRAVPISNPDSNSAATPRRREFRHRPPPLDLSAANPVRVR